MSTTTASSSLESRDLALLKYALHMAETARSVSARRLFEEYVDVELRRFEAERTRMAAKSDGDKSPKRKRG